MAIELQTRAVSSSNYEIDGKLDPILTFTRGQTYVFQRDDAGHTFYVKSALGNGSQGRYDVGVLNNGSADPSFDVSFSVPQNAPDILYYQCGAHYNMQGKILVTSAEAIEVTSGKKSLTVIANVSGSQMFLENLSETVSGTAHTIEYNGTEFNYTDIDSLITTVVRDGEFTNEFAQEIAEAFPNHAGISYSDAVTLIGQPNMEATLMAIANADGNYFG